MAVDVEDRLGGDKRLTTIASQRNCNDGGGHKDSRETTPEDPAANCRVCGIRMVFESLSGTLNPRNGRAGVNNKRVAMLPIRATHTHTPNRSGLLRRDLVEP
jgi:hypothetical protein